MKKLATILCLSAVASAAFAQGTVNPANGTTTLFRTNSIGIGGTSGNTANGAPSAGAATHGGFQYQVLTAPSTVTTVDVSLQSLLSGPWSSTGMTLTNGLLASGGRINGPSGVNGQVANWAPGAFQSFIIVGWSVDEGATWSALAANLAGAALAGGVWGQGTSGQLVNGGFIGATTLQVASSGPPDGSAPFPLFGSSGGASGTPVTTPTALWVVNVPEPTTLALAGLGIAALGIFRRRK